MKNLIHNYKNAKRVIEQIKNGEWYFHVNSLGDCYIATRGSRELQVGGKGSRCDIDYMNAFGLLFRHWVWHAAAKHEKIKAKKREIKLY